MLRRMLEAGRLMRPVDGLAVELQQAADEGRDVEALRPEAEALVAAGGGSLEQDIRVMELYRKIAALPVRESYPYNEPSTLEEIKRLRPAHRPDFGTTQSGGAQLYDKLYGAWLARCVGCLLGKPVEGWDRARIAGLAKDTGNYPLQFYISSDIGPALREKYGVSDKKLFPTYGIIEEAWINNVAYMPVDDDTNYTVLGLKIIETFGRNFTTDNVAQAWVQLLPGVAVATAERIAYRNILFGHLPPESAVYLNPYREWLGAQIRADFYGYICPGRPRLAAEYAFRDAAVSHIKNGIYGEMFMAAMIAAAAVCGDMKTVIEAGLAEIPAGSRTARGVEQVLAWHAAGDTPGQVVDKLHAAWNEKNKHHWCHTVPNAMLIAAALLYGEKDLEKTMSYAVLAGFDTDCNAASAGSVLGIMVGAGALPEKWTAPLRDRLLSNVAGYTDVRISDMAKRTAELAAF